MKKKEKAYSIALALLLIISLVFVSFAVSVSPIRDPHVTTLPQITTEAGNSSYDLSGGLFTEGNDTATESIQASAPKITESQITTNASDQWNPVIYGNKIAWEDYRNGNVGICIYDLSTKKEKSLLLPVNQISTVLISTIRR